MAFISVTRLRLRGLRFMPGFAWHTLASRRQASRADGFLGGYVAAGPGPGYWTVTAWTDRAAMLAYRNTAAHKRAMPRLIGWCNEASIAHWEQPTPALPSPADALARMLELGRVSKVRHPTPEHAAGRVAPPGPPLPGLDITPSPPRPRR